MSAINQQERKPENILCLSVCLVIVCLFRLSSCINLSSAYLQSVLSVCLAILFPFLYMLFILL